MKNNLKRYSIFIFILVILFLLVLLLIAKSYLGKIENEADQNNIIHTEQLTDEQIMQEFLEEEAETDAEDSAKEEILQLESQMEEQLDTNAEDEIIQKSEDVFNILLIGCDTRKKGGVGRSDTMILVSLNEETEKISMTSIMRDSYVSIPGKGNNRLNAAYAFGGGSLLLDTIETNFAVDVDKYVAVDFYAFVDIVDSIGGIELSISEAEIPVLNKYIKSINNLNGRDPNAYLVSAPGSQHVNGTQALAYARIRYVGNGDFERTQRQRTVITKVFEKVKTLNLLEMNDLLNAFLPQIKTNLTEGEILSLMVNALSYLQYDLESYRLPVDGSYEHMRINGMAVLGIDLKKNQDALQEIIYGEE